MTDTVTFRIDPPLDDAVLNGLFARAWPTHSPGTHQHVLARSLGYVGSFVRDELVGYVNLATEIPQRPQPAALSG
jgi:hypothetical protein